MLNTVALGLSTDYYENIRVRIVVVDKDWRSVYHSSWVSSWEALSSSVTIRQYPDRKPYTLGIEARFLRFPWTVVSVSKQIILSSSNLRDRDLILAHLRSLDNKLKRRLSDVRKERLPRVHVPHSNRAGRPNPEQTDVYFQQFQMTGQSKAYSDRSYVGHYREYISQNTTDWFKAKRKREKPDNPLHVYISEAKDGGLVWVLDDKSDPYNSRFHHRLLSESYNSYLNGQGGAQKTISHNLTNRNAALAKLSEKAGQNIANLAQDLVQFNQLTRMIEKTIHRLTNSFLALRRRDYVGAVIQLWTPGSRKPYRKMPSDKRSFAENLLEMQYGWKPLLQDIIGAAEAFSRFMLANDQLLSVRTSKRLSTNTVDLLTSGSATVGSRQTLSTTTVTFCVRYKVDNAVKALFAQTGFTNPINLFWEVLPYSFLFDWFLPVGQMLEYLSAWDGMQFHSGFETRFTKQSTIISVSYSGLLDPPHSPPDGSMTAFYGSFSGERVLVDRIPLAGFPSMKMPTMKNPFSATHALNALALFRANFRRIH